MPSEPAPLCILASPRGSILLSCVEACAPAASRSLLHAPVLCRMRAAPCTQDTRCAWPAWSHPPAPTADGCARGGAARQAPSVACRALSAAPVRRRRSGAEVVGTPCALWPAAMHVPSHSCWQAVAELRGRAAADAAAAGGGGSSGGGCAAASRTALAGSMPVTAAGARAGARPARPRARATLSRQTRRNADVDAGVVLRSKSLEAPLQRRLLLRRVRPAQPSTHARSPRLRPPRGEVSRVVRARRGREACGAAAAAAAGCETCGCLSLPHAAACAFTAESSVNAAVHISHGHKRKACERSSLSLSLCFSLCPGPPCRGVLGAGSEPPFDTGPHALTAAACDWAVAVETHVRGGIGAPSRGAGRGVSAHLAATWDGWEDAGQLAICHQQMAATLTWKVYGRVAQPSSRAMRWKTSPKGGRLEVPRPPHGSTRSYACERVAHACLRKEETTKPEAEFCWV
eukprot:364342-Chlamydomonas_euryale.AAC.2